MKHGRYPYMKTRERTYALECLLTNNPYDAATRSQVAFPMVHYMDMEHKPAVQAVLGLARAKKERKFDILTEKLEGILKNMDVVEWKGSDMIAALKLLAQLHDLMPDSKQPKTLNLNFFDVKDANPQQLAQRLAEIQEQERMQEQAIDVDTPQEEAKEDNE